MIYFLIQSTWAQDSTSHVAVQNQLLHGIANAGIIVQTLLLCLIGMSVWNWVIIFKKKNQFQVVKDENNRFLDYFWSANNLQQIHSKVDEYPQSPAARIFNSGYQELEKVLSAQNSSLLMTGIENLERTLRKSHDQEVSNMESQLSILATTGSTAPFVGLLGTVIGIMNSFGDIAKTGSASLAVVAPGISEALFATAMGLVAAIPAVVAYNYLINDIKRCENQLNGFGADFLNIARRNFLKQN